MRSRIVFRCLLLVGVCMCASPRIVTAQAKLDPPKLDPLTGGLARLAAFVKGNVIKSAERMSEEHYAFRPTPEVRSFGAILGHIANSNYQFCSQAAGEANPSKRDIEKTVTAKAELTVALQESFAYCDRVLNGMTDGGGSEIVKSSVGEFPKLSVLTVNTAHNFEHYGNLITYLRIKGLVPPSSDPK